MGHERENDAQECADRTVDEAAAGGNETAQEMQKLRARERAKVARAVQRARWRGGKS